MDLCCLSHQLSAYAYIHHRPVYMFATPRWPTSSRMSTKQIISTSFEKQYGDWTQHELPPTGLPHTQNPATATHPRGLQTDIHPRCITTTRQQLGEPRIVTLIDPNASHRNGIDASSQPTGMGG